MSRLFVAIQLVCNILSRTMISTTGGSFSADFSSSQFLDPTPSTSLVFQKTMAETLAMWWEAYFSKNLVIYFVSIIFKIEISLNTIVVYRDFKNTNFQIGAGSNSLLDHLNQIDFRTTLMIMGQICTCQHATDTIITNIYHVFLRFMYLNLNDSAIRPAAQSSSVLTSSFNTS